MYRAIAETLAARSDTFEVFFLGYARSSRSWAIAPDDLGNIPHVMADGGWGRALWLAMRHIRARRPRVVVLAWAMDHVALALLCACRLWRIPVVVVSGETDRSAANNPWPRLRRVFRAPFFRMASRFLSYGERSTRYLLGCGVPAGRITTGVNTVDVAYFQERARQARHNGVADAMRAAFRRADGSAFETHLLFVGYLHAEKGAGLCLDLLERLGESGVALHIVGDGPLRHILAADLERRGLADRAFMHGYQQIETLPEYYAMADMFLFPSLEEVYGLVLVEAAAAGLPIVASTRAGGAADVVRDGVNGYLFDPARPAEMERAVRLLLADAGLHRQMGSASAAIAVERFGMQRSAWCYRDAVDRAGLGDNNATTEA